MWADQGTRRKIRAEKEKAIAALLSYKSVEDAARAVEVDDIHSATQKAKSLGGQGHEGCHGGDGHGLAQLHSGSDGRVLWGCGNPNRNEGRKTVEEPVAFLNR